jgi:5-formyltetrahydrofolate cyclo-ligase
VNESDNSRKVPNRENLGERATEGIESAKHKARAIARSVRKAIPLERRQELSALICAHISKSEPWNRSEIVLGYFAGGSEVSLEGLLMMTGPTFASLRIPPDGPFPTDRPDRDFPAQNTSGEHLALPTFGAPIVEGENMRFAVVRRGVEGSPVTVLGPYDLREPDGPAVDLAKVGLVLVPLLAFDAGGNRLGSGRGFYDRFLTGHPELVQHAVIMGVAFQAQRVSDLPVEPHDHQLDAVVTEAGITKFH